LWEVDSQGHLRHVSTRLAASFACDPAALLKQPFVELIAASFGTLADEEHISIKKLRDCLNAHVPFRDIAVAINIDGDIRWWSLTAKPLLSANGDLQGWRGVGADITAAQIANQEMNRLANFDSLTGLANRHLFRTQLERITHNESERGCTLFFLDLDNFKLVNDSLGHAVGDKLLVIVAQRLSSRIQQGDLLARIGGDEFALICWHLHHPEAVAKTAERLLDALREPCVVDGSIIQTGTSIGIALAPRDADTPEALLNSADMALYAAKSGGRNTYRFFDRDIDSRARRRSTIQLDLHQALERSEFLLHFQPQIDAQTRAVVGFEALLRWQHPSGHMIAPDDFIPIAEETGLIVPIGAWVLNVACSTAMQWPAPLSVAVNLSAPQFAAAELVNVVRNALTHSGLPAHRLELEVTESLLIHDSSDALETLATLRKMGVRVALDDFGTGYSSLAYLRTFPLDKLKIDRSFVASLEGDIDAQAIVSAIIDLARALRLSTTAEGVETQAQLSILTALGCSDIQGYFFARPMAATQIENFLQQWPASNIN
jgi:diguanylate cyclase (GGDEF)-like protein